jgi:hypothetical protein
MAANNYYLGLTMGQADVTNLENVVTSASSNAGPGQATAADIEVRIQTDPGTGPNNIRRRQVISALEVIIQFIESGGSAWRREPAGYVRGTPMGVIPITGVVAFDTLAQQSETQRQSEEANAIPANANDAWLRVEGSAFSSLQIALNAASIAHYRRLLAAALANGLDTGVWSTALAQLGTGGQ